MKKIYLALLCVLVTLLSGCNGPYTFKIIGACEGEGTDTPEANGKTHDVTFTLFCTGTYTVPDGGALGPSDASIEAGTPDATLVEAAVEAASDAAIESGASDSSDASAPDASFADAAPETSAPVPTCSDGIKNQDETDVDCGGTVCATRCAVWKGCAVASDCDGVIANRCAMGECNPINFVVFIEQENHSFDNYFGTRPGVDGFANAPPWIPDPKAPSGHARPYHTTVVKALGAAHERNDSLADIHGGLMDGFCTNAEKAQAGCCDHLDPACATGTIDVTGYFDRGDLPRYWQLADLGVLHNYMFSGISGASTTNHQDVVTATSLFCTQHNNGDSCSIDVSYNNVLTNKIMAATDITYLLHQEGIPWKEYGTPVSTNNSWPHCNPAHGECPPICPNSQQQRSSDFWLALMHADDVGEDGETANGNAKLDDFFADVHAHTLPMFSLIIPGMCWSEHQPQSVTLGQSYVVGLLNALAHEPSIWNHLLVWLFWDDWGGYWDHVPPPTIDGIGYGIRVPSLLIGPWVRENYIDQQVLSFDAGPKLLEDEFLEGQRLDPATMGRHDSRPSVRENASQLGDLRNGLDKTLTSPRTLPFPLPQ